MHMITKCVSRAALAASLTLLATSGCTGADPMTGTWTQSGATTALPPAISSDPLMVDATLDLDGDASPAAFDLFIGLSFEGLSDSVSAQGTYVEDGDDLTLTITGFDIDPASGNSATVGDDGSQCHVLMGFGGANVCFPAPQTNGFTLDGDSLAITIDQSIAGAPMTETHLSLTRL